MDLPDLPHVVGVAERHLRPLGNRWLHTQAVAGRAAELSVTVDDADRPLLVAAAWWHDIGYGATQHDTGLHPLDGARWLAAQGYPPRLCALVAHHSAATYEAEQRGLARELAVWPNEQSAVTDALWTSDMTTGPAGQRYSYPQRLAEILNRYPPGSEVAAAMTAAQPTIEAATARVTARLSR
ncbi:MAG: HD domain-containing protein [Pseudonocardia sp.]|nr:HD domain-containing protein [Pseudonocardia sp.]